MSLPVPNLDDRRFQDLVDEAKRLIPRFCPEWTNHNLSDPGIALVELFAWMTEMVLYRVNQVPDAYYTRFLNLMGVEPYPPAAARTELLFWLTGAINSQVVVPAGTQVSTAGESESQVFSTLDDLVMSQPQLRSARVSTNGEVFVDVWDDLTFDRTTVSVFASNPPQPDDALYLGFAGSLAGSVLRLDVDADIEGIGVDPNRPPLVWEIYADETWVAMEVIRDLTGGLNRWGEVVLMAPPVHEPLSLGGSREFWLRVRLTEPLPGQPTYQASPRIRTLQASTIGGTVAAEHSQLVHGEHLGQSDGRPGQVFQIRHFPVLPRRRGELVRLVVEGVEQDWTEVGDFAESGPEDRHVVWDSTTGEIRFGPTIRYPDGSHRQHGAVASSGAEVGISSYRHGGGSAGNVGAHTLIESRSAIPFVAEVSNPRPASGGVDAESVENAKLRGPGTVRTGERAVTASDFERLALAADTSLARARALPARYSGGPVRLLLVPSLDSHYQELSLDDFVLSDHLLDRVGTHLDARRLVGSSIELATPYYQGVSVAALIKALPGRPYTLVRQRALDVLYRYVNPLVGGPDGTGWSFEVDLNAAVLHQLLGAVDGVDRVEEVVLFEYDLRNGTRTGRGVDVIRLGSDSLFLSAAHRVVIR